MKLNNQTPSIASKQNKKNPVVNGHMILTHFFVSANDQLFSIFNYKLFPTDIFFFPIFLFLYMQITSYRKILSI